MKFNKLNIVRVGSVLLLLAVSAFVMQSIKWYRAGDGAILTVEEEYKMPLDKIENPEPDVVYYRAVTKKFTYKRDSFPLISVKEEQVGERYFSKE